MYFLIDLERTIGSGTVHYWKGNRHGYTRNPNEAGKFSPEKAAEIEKNDFNKWTIKIHEQTIEKIINP